jgi:hypothetical protein
MAIAAEEALYIRTGGALGLPFLGDRTVNFRVGAVYQPTTRDTLDRSIVSRNLMRQGVNAKEALKYVFPEKSEQEIAVMVGSGGLPSEYLRDAMAILSQLSSFIDPLTGLPLTDPRTGVPLVQAILPFIVNALSYGQQFYSSTSNSQSQSTASARAESGLLRSVVNRLAQLAQQRRNATNNVVSTDNRSDAGLASAPIPGILRAPTGSPTDAINPVSTQSPNANSPFAKFFNPAYSPIFNFLRWYRG